VDDYDDVTCVLVHIMGALSFLLGMAVMSRLMRRILLDFIPLYM
jgi:hypothetical protein